jgi:hypothetical protein
VGADGRILENRAWRGALAAAVAVA